MLSQRPASSALQICQTCRLEIQHVRPKRLFSSTRNRLSDNGTRQGPFRSRLRSALRDTKIQWYTIPAGVGIGFLGLVQFYKTQARERADREDDELKPKRRPRVRPSGPWTVQIMSYLPLKGISRVWGWFNELTIPYYLRTPGFKLYSWIFGVNLAEMEDQDLTSYRNLAAFFYRTLKPGVRPLDPNMNAILSPADGKVLQYGIIQHGEVEQIKGMTYSLEALLGSASPTLEGAPSDVHSEEDAPNVKDGTDLDEEFANVNGISYRLPTARGGEKTEKRSVDASTTPRSSSEAEVRADLALNNNLASIFSLAPSPSTALHFIVIYLAPGDYHRFHSPVSWVAEKRRHFAGELYSVSPYLQRTLPGLFTLNERVALLGRWRYGFFSFTPVGATNVGSIKINFDRELRTNSLLTDTEADRAAERAAKRGEPYLGYAEASYEKASKLLKGHALRRGEEMGGFQLGSSIVLVFEAPVDKDEGGKEGWQWQVDKDQKVKYGEALGFVKDA